MVREVISTKIENKAKEILRKAGDNITTGAREHLEKIAAKIASPKHLKELDSLLENAPPARSGPSSKSTNLVGPKSQSLKNDLISSDGRQRNVAERVDISVKFIE
ncbi:MAG: hypothetical protein ACRECH_14510 [Nitrososphaerales archaeon]